MTTSGTMAHRHRSKSKRAVRQCRSRRILVARGGAGDRSEGGEVCEVARNESDRLAAGDFYCRPRYPLYRVEETRKTVLVGFTRKTRYIKQRIARIGLGPGFAQRVQRVQGVLGVAGRPEFGQPGNPQALARGRRAGDRRNAGKFGPIELMTSS